MTGVDAGGIDSGRVAAGAIDADGADGDVGYVIRPFAQLADYRACVELQEDTWGRGFSERVAPAILKVAQILGGVSAGAFTADGTMIGFVFGLTGVRDGETVHWSDMLAVRPGIRDHGLGRRLKAYQRARVMEHGISKMFWTFDPLQSRNAHLNFNRLGIVVREYAEDMYGDTDSPLHSGIGTDRFIALWRLDDARVASMMDALEGGDDGPRSEAGGSEERGLVAHAPTGALPAALAGDATARLPRPRTPNLTLSSSADDVLVQVPSDLAAVMRDDMPLAQAWRAATREAFTHYLACGYEVRGFARGDRVSTYRVSRMRTRPDSTTTEEDTT